jgi:aminopeptidase N
VSGASQSATASAREPGVSHELAKWRATRYRDIRYALDIELAEGQQALHGTIGIEMTLPRSVPDVILDWRPAAGARLFELQVNGAPAPVTVKNEHVTIARRLLRPGRNFFHAAFAAPISVSGGAVTRYRDREDGSEYLYTLFVPADASTIFPCFDQPDLKARFRLQLTAPRSWTVIGNSASLETSDVGTSARRWRFDETPPISTYVFAFAAGPFVELREAGSATRLFVRRSRRQRAQDEAPEVLRLNRDALQWLANYFDRPFPFPKYDLVLVPEFAYGGMEHAGATFLREESVLFPSAPNENDRLRRAELVFHEATHQWFGDLVTMGWFDDLWLKEGFANFMAAKAADALLPQFPAWNAFHALKVAAYRTDATRGTTPIRQPLANLAAAKSAYGNIVYSKAPGVLKQAEFYVGEEVFRSAVRLFVARHAWGTASWADLVRSLEEASGRRLDAWADVWVKRRGMPRVRISWNADAAGVVKEAAATQEDVLHEGGVWPMKLRAVTLGAAGARDFDFVLPGKRAALKPMIGMPRSEIVFANEGDYGYGQFLLDDASRAAVLARPESIDNGLLRALLFDALWESVREAELAPLDYLHFALRTAPAEPDPITLATLLARVTMAFEHYLSDEQRAAVAPQLEQVLIENLRDADTPGRRISFLRAFMDCAWSEGARERLKDLLADRLQVPGVPLSSRDRFRIIGRLLTLGDPEGPALLAAQSAADVSDDGRRYAYAAAAASPDPRTKREYFERALRDATLPESWTEAALFPLNAVEHAGLTAPLLEPALRALPELKRSRKIFFVNDWLAAFLGGQSDASALQKVQRFLREPGLDPDLRLKVLEAVDGLERSVKIRERFARQ